MPPSPCSIKSASTAKEEDIKAYQEKYSQEPDHGAKDASTWEQPNRKRGDHIQPGHIWRCLRGKFGFTVTQILPSNVHGWDRPIYTLRSNPKGGTPGRGCEQAERDQRCVLPPPYTDAGSC